MDEEMRDAIRWLNGPDGRRWSRARHRQNPHSVKWFSFKRDIENPRYGYETGTGSNEYVDRYEDVVTIDLGRYDGHGQRYYRGPKAGYQAYGKDTEDVRD